MKINKKILAIIPARGGSKSIPRKNIISVGGKPLLAWTIKASLGSKYINKTVVSSEDDEILQISRRYSAETVKRPPKLAQDNTLMMPVIKDCISQLKNKNENFDILILLQPTSPLRNSKDIDAAFKLFYAKKATALISGYEPSKSPFKSFKVSSKGFLKGLVDDATPFMNRQYLPQAFYPNGAIYIIYIKDFIESNKLFTSKTIPFFMPHERSVDIDTMEDITKIDMILKNDKYARNKQS